MSIERHKHGSKLCPTEQETRLVLLINKERINERAGKETYRISGWFPPRFPLTLLFLIIREAFDKYAWELCWRVLIAFEDNSQWERYLAHEIFNKLTVTAFITFIPEEMKTYFWLSTWSRYAWGRKSCTRVNEYQLNIFCYGNLSFFLYVVYLRKNHSWPKRFS